MLEPDAVAARTFGSSFRGYDPEEVRRFLVEVAAELRSLAAGVLEGIDDDRAAALVGEEAGRLLAAARAAADAAIARGEEKAAEVLREAQEEAIRLRATVEAERDRALAEGAALAEAALLDIERSRQAIEAEARAEADRLVAEAVAAREHVLRDLARRRSAVRAQVEQLHAAREKLLDALGDIARSVEEARGRLVVALPEAKVAADAAARRVQAEPELTVEQLEAELEAFRLAGIDLTASASVEPAPAPMPPADDATLTVASVEVEPPDGEPEAQPAEEVGRRSSSVRVFRARRDVAPALGLPEAELQPVEAGAPFEGVRVLPNEPEEVAAEAAAQAEVGAAEVAAGGELSGHVEAVEAAPEVVGVEAPVEPGELEAVAAAGRAQPDDVEPGEVVAEATDDGEPVEPGAAEGARSSPVEPEDDADSGEPVEVGATDGRQRGHVEAPEAGAAVVGAEPQAAEGERLSTHAVDALFARLRAGRAARTSAAEEVLADVGTVEPEPEPDAVPEPERTVEPEPEPAAEVVVEEVAVHVGGGPDREGLLARRDQLLAEPTAALTRRLKRLLADEQNELLDALRRGGTGSVVGIDTLAERWAGSAADDLRAAATAGASFLGADASAPDDVDLDDIAAELAAAVAVPLATRLADGLRRAEGDTELAADSVRATCREWRSRRLADGVEHAVRAAFGRGALTSIPPGTGLCWVVDDGGSPCPDAEDNALAGVVPAGEAYPTGHRHPPAHPGCRCVLARPA